MLPRSSTSLTYLRRSILACNAAGEADIGKRLCGYSCFSEAAWRGSRSISKHRHQSLLARTQNRRSWLVSLSALIWPSSTDDEEFGGGESHDTLGPDVEPGYSSTGYQGKWLTTIPVIILTISEFIESGKRDPPKLRF
jgi:hypothetical protein